MIKGYGWVDIEAFFISWKKNCSNADCVIFYDDISEWTLSQIKNIHEDDITLKLIKIPEQYQDRIVVDVRCSLYKDFLEKHKNEYVQALLTDVRDVIFQGDLFKSYEQYDKYLGYSTEELPLSEVTNKTWLTRCFGDAEYQKLKDKKIICNGTIFGTIEELIIFLTKMEKYLETNKYWGADQAIANYLIYNKLLPIETMIESDVNSGMLLTNGWRSTPVKEDKILNFNKQVPAVIHQYDRHKHLIGVINRNYRLRALNMQAEDYDLKSKLDMIQCLTYAGVFEFSLKEQIKFIEKYSKPEDWKETTNRLIRIVNIIIESEKRNVYMELLSQAVCHSIFFSLHKVTLSFEKIQTLYEILYKLKKRQISIYMPYKMNVEYLLLQIIKACEANEDYAQVAMLYQKMQECDYQMTSADYLVSAKANRMLGNKDKALEDYKKSVGQVN